MWQRAGTSTSTNDNSDTNTDQVRFLLVVGPEGSSHSLMSMVFKNSSTYALLQAAGALCNIYHNNIQCFISVSASIEMMIRIERCRARELKSREMMR